MGRFLSPVWTAKEDPVPYARLDNPQTLNLYSYVQNNPLSQVDKDGHCIEDLCIGEAIAVTALAAATVSYLESPQGQQSLYAGAQLLQMGAHALSNIFNKSTEQGRDAQGKFLPKQPGQTQPGADAEKGALQAEGATKTGTSLPGTDRRVDGTVTDTGQKIEVKSGGSVTNSGQLVETDDGRAYLQPRD